MKQRQKSRAGQSVTDEQLATYTAARAFLFGEWLGATLMVASFTQLYIVLFAFGGDATVTLIVGGVLLLLGGYMFWTNRTYFLRLEVDWRRRWEVAAVIIAGTGVVFWLLFGLLWVLVWQGVPIQN